MTAGGKKLALLAVLVAVLAGFVTFVFFNRTAPETNDVWRSLPFQSEDEWIVSQTAVSVVDLAQYARTGKPTPLSSLALSRLHADSGRPGLLFRVGSRDVSIPLATHVWDPDAYVELARREGITGEPGPVNDDIVTALLDLKVETLRLQNDTVSIALQNGYRNPANHDAAALLLTTFALRESSGFFYDPRLAMSRAAAHLAIARALRGTATLPSQAGLLAAVMLDITAGRAGPALKALDELERTHASDAVGSWSRALRRRATLDWRVPADDGAPLVERLEYMRSLARMVGVSISLQYLTRHQPEPVPDWGWRTIDFPMTVENGHVFITDTINRTLSEAYEVLRLSPSSMPAEISAALSREPAASSIGRGTARRIEVLDAGTWSAFYQRQLAHVAMKGSEFYREMLGAPDAAADFEREVDALMGDTPLWPIVLRLRVETECQCNVREENLGRIAATYQATMARVAPLIREKPQLVPFLAWTWLQKPPHPSIAPINTVFPNQWFRTIYPTGTAFEGRRMNTQKTIPGDFQQHADALHALAPWDPLVTINWSIVKCARQGGCTAEQQRANYANIADYHLDSMEKFAETTEDPATAYRRICDIAPDQCVRLADWYRGHDQFREAAAAFQLYFDRALDRVDVSNNVEWLVRYYQKEGQAAQARTIAHAAADTGSAGGMAALAGVYEREGNSAKAEELYRAILNRYDNGARLLSFLLRRADVSRVPASGPDYDGLVQRYFDGNIERVATESLADRPSRGLLVRSVPTWQSKYFRRGDLIVAMDGVRVWKNAQSQVQFDRSFDAPLRFTVWRDNKFIDITGPFRTYYYRVDTIEDPPLGRR